MATKQLRALLASTRTEDPSPASVGRFQLKDRWYIIDWLLAFTAIQARATLRSSHAPQRSSVAPSGGVGARYPSRHVAATENLDDDDDDDDENVDADMSVSPPFFLFNS